MSTDDLDQWAFKAPKKVPWTVSELKNPENHLAYMNKMVAELKERNIEKKPATTVQSASTQRLMEMTDAEAETYRARKLPTKEQWWASPDAEQAFEKHIADDQTKHAAAHARHRKDNNTIGQQEIATVSTHKAPAIEAFINAIPAPMTAFDNYKISAGHVREYEPRSAKRESILKTLSRLVGRMLKPSAGENDHFVSRQDIEDWEKRNK